MMKPGWTDLWTSALSQVDFGTGVGEQAVHLLDEPEAMAMARAKKSAVILRKYTIYMYI